MKWIKNNCSKLLLFLAIILIIAVYSLNIYNTEKKSYESYADYSRADIIMTLTFNKEFQFYSTRRVQSFNNDKKLSEGDLIYDYAQYKFMPMLSYLNNPSEDKDLITSFQKFLNFHSDYYLLMLGQREKIFERQKNGKYFIQKNDIYTYFVKMDVIGKKGLNSVYNEYLKNLGYNNVEDKFINDLYLKESIKNKYNNNELINNVKNNYKVFYYGNEKEILEVITKDLDDFIKYIYTYYIYLDTSNNDNLVLLKEIETEPIELTFNLTIADRHYSPVSKYYKYSYKLDINDVWEQLEKKGYPKIYS